MLVFYGSLLNPLSLWLCNNNTFFFKAKRRHTKKRRSAFLVPEFGTNYMAWLMTFSVDVVLSLYEAAKDRQIATFD